MSGVLPILTDARGLSVERLLPLTKHKHAPKVSGAVEPVPLVLVPDLLEEGVIEDSILAGEQHVVRILLQFPSEPPVQGHRKSLFLAVQNVPGQNWFHCFLQDVLSIRVAYFQR